MYEASYKPQLVTVPISRSFRRLPRGASAGLGEYVPRRSAVWAPMQYGSSRLGDLADNLDPNASLPSGQTVAQLRAAGMTDLQIRLQFQHAGLPVPVLPGDAVVLGNKSSNSKPKDQDNASNSSSGSNSNENIPLTGESWFGKETLVTGVKNGVIAGGGALLFMLLVTRR